MLHYRLHDVGQAGFSQYPGTFQGLASVGSYARLRSRATASLDHGPWSFEWTGRFISGARVLGAPFGKALGIFYQDIEASRMLAGVTLMAGIDNLADRRPPTLVDGTTNTDTSTYDVLGRVFWARVGFAF